MSLVLILDLGHVNLQLLESLFIGGFDGLSNPLFTDSIIDLACMGSSSIAADTLDGCQVLHGSVWLRGLGSAAPMVREVLTTLGLACCGVDWGSFWILRR